MNADVGKGLQKKDRPVVFGSTQEQCGRGQARPLVMAWRPIRCQVRACPKGAEPVTWLLPCSLVYGCAQHFPVEEVERLEAGTALSQGSRAGNLPLLL